jgi:hypothetical protein
MLRRRCGRAIRSRQRNPRGKALATNQNSPHNPYGSPASLIVTRRNAAEERVPV